MDDIALLRRYTGENSGEAFDVLVARHINNVYSVALRHTRNPHQAEEITQRVFIILARKARLLSKRVVLSGWLYKTARLTAVTFIRSEVRRARREQEACMQNQLNESEPEVWPQIAPFLDAAMAGLKEADRDAIVLRFFDGRRMSEVGAAIGTSEDTARKRVSRALEKLRLSFAKRGFVLPVAVLEAALSSNSVQAAPAGLAKTISVAAVAHGAAATSSVSALCKGVLKPLFTWPAAMSAMVAAMLGSVFFILRSEIENTKSPRERQFVLRMIWFRFTAAFLLTGVPILVGIAMPSVFRHPNLVVFGFACLCFCGAIESAARIIYFQRHRRRIQIEDGTWEELPGDEKAQRAGLLANLPEKAAQTSSYMTKAAACSLVACIIATAYLLNWTIAGGYWVASLFVLLWAAFALFRTRNGLRWSRIVSYARFMTSVKTVVYFGLLTLLLFDLCWARGRLTLSAESAIGFNALVVLAYAALSGIFGWLYRQLPGRSAWK